MSDLRWHPYLGQWVVVSAHRQHRPQLPRDSCVFCPGSGRVPDHYDALLYTPTTFLRSIPPAHATSFSIARIITSCPLT